MPQIKSQIKRVKITAIEKQRNTAKKTKVKNAIKKYNGILESKDIESAEQALREVTGIIHSACLDGVYKKNNASRKVSSLARKLVELKKAE